MVESPGLHSDPSLPNSCLQVAQLCANTMEAGTATAMATAFLALYSMGVAKKSTCTTANVALKNIDLKSVGS